jgi:hypothetical protein
MGENKVRGHEDSEGNNEREFFQKNKKQKQLKLAFNNG